jgi:excisionase family DNA binding protein
MVTRPDSSGAISTGDAQALPHDPLQLLSVDDVCKLLRVSRWQVYRLVNSRELATIQINRRRLFRRLDLQRYIDSLSGAGDSSMRDAA